MRSTAKQIQKRYERWLVTPHFIYVLCDPDTLAVRYVGCTHNPQDRIRQHCTCCSKSKPLRDWLLSLRSEGKRPVMMIIEKCDGPYGGRESEKRVIAGYRRLLGHRLLNGGSRAQQFSEYQVVSLVEGVA